jgi:serine/threonine protein kinase
MGDVYKARDTCLDRAVAVKVLPAAFAGDPDVRRRFEREARAISALRHPHICVLHDVGRREPPSGSGPAVDFLVMEYLAFDPFPDGQRFLVQELPEQASSRATLVTNWSTLTKP